MIDAARGLSASEVAERVARGEVNRLPPSQTRTYGQIVRANVLTRFNALLGAMLVIILVVGPFQDSLFGFVLVANAAVGIVQEVRAKRTLERLTVLTAPKAHVIRDGEVHVIPVEEVVADEVLEVSLGGQVVVDGEVLASEGLEIDESLITGESDPVQKAPGDTVRSGSFAVAGTGRYRATAIGSDAYAVKLAQEARRFALTRSELRSGVDRILVWVTWAIVPTGALLFFSQLRSDHGWHESISGAVAGTVAMVPEGHHRSTASVRSSRRSQRSRARTSIRTRRCARSPNGSPKFPRAGPSPERSRSRRGGSGARRRSATDR